TTGDEVGQLASRFNWMAMQLEDREKQLNQNITELDQTLQHLSTLQANLIAEKMSSLGKMVAGIAHEINNPVNFIHGNVPHAKNYLQDLRYLLELYKTHSTPLHPEIEEAIADIDPEFLLSDFEKILTSMRHGSDRIRAIVLDLRNFSRLDESDQKQVDLHDGLEGALNMLRYRLTSPSLKQEISVIKNYGDLPWIHCYAGQVNQVFLNLLSNAIDALESVPNSAAPPQITLTTSVNPENTKVTIEIADNGPGIPSKTLKQIFDPFFTTKPIGQGTGLGLTVSYQIIVHRHHGNLTCNSEVGQGTVIAIELPVESSDQPTTKNQFNLNGGQLTPNLEVNLSKNEV
ncbi:MAG: GHKL domain-containing protein, partial [Kamptonema sp. SIO4C4]|nr:GHKL domain-containing protein [Kamptonema sp. SIO4C4]